MGHQNAGLVKVNETSPHSQFGMEKAISIFEMKNLYLDMGPGKAKVE